MQLQFERNLDCRLAAIHAAGHAWPRCSDGLGRAETFAEALQYRVCTDLWGYVPDEALANEDLINEKYRGIRPAPGYPACPDHSLKGSMFELLQCAEIGMGITESLAMTPAASVSGFYLSHPEATYFNVGKIGHEQLRDQSLMSKGRCGSPRSTLRRSISRSGSAAKRRLLTSLHGAGHDRYGRTVARVECCGSAQPAQQASMASYRASSSAPAASTPGRGSRLRQTRPPPAKPLSEGT